MPIAISRIISETSDKDDGIGIQSLNWVSGTFVRINLELATASRCI
jgi:hypothetical protein